MRTIRTALMIVATATTFGFAAGARAQEKPCMADAAKLCPNVEPGGGAQMQCLKEHKDELSPACKKKVMQMKAKHMEKEQQQQAPQQQNP
jgi:hypothetical protein